MCSAQWDHPTHGPTKCGRCMECRLAYSREWAIRMTHEAQMHKECCSGTLTYNDEFLPEHGQLVKRDAVLFLKRLRKLIGSFRYVLSGEYGETNRRPHFHFALYGRNFSEERLYYGRGSKGDPLFTSATIAKAWSLHGESLGIHTIGDLTFESAAYIARYITGKLTPSERLSLLPLHIDKDTGEMIFPNPEFLIMSKGRRAGQGIGGSWFRDYFMTDVFPHGSVITPQGSRAPVPLYYKRLLKELGADLALEMSGKVLASMDKSLPKLTYENSPQRRAARTKVASARTKLFKRDVKLQKD